MGGHRYALLSYGTIHITSSEQIEKASQILDLAIAEKQFSAAVAVRSQACA
jgi:hypothetical protein